MTKASISWLSEHTRRLRTVSPRDWRYRCPGAADKTDAERTLSALLEFGAPVQAHGISAHDFSREDAVYQIGLPPRRIDLLTSISAVSFDEACAQALVGRIGPHEVRFIGLDALIKNKRAAGRPKDVADASQLEQLKRGAQ